MSKGKFLLVSLEENEAKQLADVISNPTSRKIINYLSEQKDATETKLSEELGQPLSTIHYNLQKLKKAKLVEADTFTYSAKGREIDHYRLVNKYVIITPKPVKGIKTHLKSILPAGLLIAGVSAIIHIIQKYTGQFAGIARETITTPIMKSIPEAAPLAAQAAEPAMKLIADSDLMADTETAATQTVADNMMSVNQTVKETVTVIKETIVQEPNIALWFFIGGMAALTLYLFYRVIRD